MLKPLLVNLRSKPTPAFDVYIGRAMPAPISLPQSKWANPFTIQRDEERSHALEQYREHLLRSPQLLLSLPELAGQRIACWCHDDRPLSEGERPVDKACHGHILQAFVEALRGPATKQMRAMCMDTIAKEDERQALAWAKEHDFLPQDVHDWNDAPLADCVRFILRDVAKREPQGMLF